MALDFYDLNGRPIAYTEDGIHIYLFSGEPAAYLQDDSVYSYSGKHLGWLLDGWIRDHRGNAVLFTEKSLGGPIKPIRQLKPLKSIRNIRPIKSIRQIKPIKPIKSFNWSDLVGEEFFFQ